MRGRLVFPPNQSVLKALRAKVRAVASSLGATPEVCDSLALVVDELVNNAVEHGAAYRQKALDLVIELGSSGDRISIEFFDQEMPAADVHELARALSAAASGMPSLESERGRGLFLMSVYLEGLRAEIGQVGGLRLVGMVAKR